MDYLSDDEIVTRLRDSSERERNDLLKEVYMKYFPIIESYVINNSGTPAEAADVFQDAIIVFYEKIRNKELKMSSTIKTFLYALSKNIWLNKIRRRKKMTLKHEFDENITDLNIKHLEVIEFSERNEILNKLINNLGPRCKEILTYYYYDRLSMKKISSNMGFSNEQGAKNKKSKCLKKLKIVVKNSLHLTNELK